MLQLNLVKVHLRVDHDLDDVLVQAYMDAARERVSQHLNRTIIDDESKRTHPRDLIDNKMIDLATLKLVGHFYAQREVVLGAEVHVLNEWYELLQPYRIIYGE